VDGSDPALRASLARLTRLDAVLYADAVRRYRPHCNEAIDGPILDYAI
jgi:hypothetical protein